nr:MAG: hypothetical protein [Microvirus sp.]
MTTKTKGFVFTKPSKTVPGQVMSLKTILTRFRKGQGVQVFEGQYNPDFPPEFDGLDKLDRMDAAREMAAEVNCQRSVLSRQPTIKEVEEVLKTVVQTTDDKKLEQKDAK